MSYPLDDGITEYNYLNVWLYRKGSKRTSFPPVKSVIGW